MLLFFLIWTPLKADILENFCWFFGQNDDTQKTFRNELTFTARRKLVYLLMWLLLLQNVTLTLLPQGFVKMIKSTYLCPRGNRVNLLNQSWLMVNLLLKGAPFQQDFPRSYIIYYVWVYVYRLCKQLMIP